MSKDELWKVILSKNPHFLTSGAHFTPEGLIKFFNLAYSKGYSEGLMQSFKDSQVDQNNQTNSTNEFDDIFSIIFGKKY